MSGVPRSQRLFTSTFTDGGNSNVWVCPDNVVTLVKSVVLYNSSTLQQDFQVRGGLSSGLQINMIHQMVEPGQAMYLETWYVLHPGDYTYINCSDLNSACWVSGAVLAGAPLFPPSTTLLRDLPEANPLPTQT